MPSPRLTLRQERFVAEYVTCLNGKQAAIRAGYSPKTAKTQAANMLALPQFQEAVNEAKDAYLARCEVTSEKTLRELALIAYADMADFLQLDKNGEAVLDWSALPPGVSKVIGEITQEVYVEGRGRSARTVKKTKFKLHSKTQALEMLGKYLSLFKDNDQAPKVNPLDKFTIVINRPTPKPLEPEPNRPGNEPASRANAGTGK